MSLLGKIVRGVGDVIEDAVKIGVQPVASTISSVTGKKVDIGNYNTGVGNVIGGVTKVGVESGNAAFKSFADTALGGLPSKVANLVRDDQYKESPGNYYETRTQTFTSGPLAKFESGAEKASLVVGSLAATVMKSKEAGKPTEASPGVKPLTSIIKPVETGSSIVPKLLNTESNVSILGTITQGINKIGDLSKTPVGQQLSGLLGNVVGNLLQPAKAAPSTVPQVVALDQGKSPTIAEATKLSVPQKALFGGSGVGVQVTGLPGGTQPSWWDSNKVWFIPVSIVFGAVAALITIISFFTRKRR